LVKKPRKKDDNEGAGSSRGLHPSGQAESEGLNLFARAGMHSSRLMISNSCRWSTIKVEQVVAMVVMMRGGTDYPW
jgi:hypothetical protein